MSGRAGRFVGSEPSLVLFKDPHCGYITAMMACNTDLDQVLRLLRQEREANPVYDNAWRIARDQHRSNSHQGGTGQAPEECYIAVTAYTLETPLYRDFNDKCRRLCDQGSWHRFGYKSLYCLLSRAAKGFHSNPPIHYRLYRGISLHFDPNTFRDGLVCFNQFSSSSADRDRAMQFTSGNGTLVEFPHGARAAMGIANLSVSPWEQEVLIFPWSTFRISKYERTGPVHRIVLESAGPRMDFTTCAYPGTNNPCQSGGPTCPTTFGPPSLPHMSGPPRGAVRPRGGFNFHLQFGKP